MKSDSVEIRLLSRLVAALLCFVPFVEASNSSYQNPQQNTQQRPRRVGSEQAPANTNSQSQSKPAGEEVGEGGFDVAQMLHVGDEARALESEDEIIGRFFVPAAE